LERLLHSGFLILLAYGAAIVGVCALQLVPYLGWIVLAMLGPLWVGLLVHLMMLTLAGSAVAGYIFRAWLVVPLAYYAGGYALHEVSLNRARDMAIAIEQAAQKATIKVDQPFAFLNKAGNGGLQLLKHYRVDRAFVGSASGPITSWYFARGEACIEGIRNGRTAARGQPSLLEDLFHGNHDRDKTRQCLLSQSGLPATWRYRIESRYLTGGDTINARFGSVYEVIDQTTDAPLLTVETGTIGTLPPVQTIILICSLYSGPLTCHFELQRDEAMIPIGYKLPPPNYSNFADLDDPETWEIGILARALSLEPRTRSD
jgi:hypothetical protein